MEGTKIRLWKHTNEEGKTYLSGRMSKVTRLVVIENDRKKKPQDPDYYAYLVPTRQAGTAQTDSAEE